MSRWLLVAMVGLGAAMTGAPGEGHTRVEPRMQDAIALMKGFADRTGLTAGRPPERYLWTDAFAVCTYLGLAQATGEERYSELALTLIDQVHHTLGRHRADDPRTGWISGLAERAGEDQPLKGGLRIGKMLPERGPGAPYDERQEWDRDGQYFHYLTKWMHALDQATRATAQPVFNQWARELARTAYDAFTYVPDRGRRRMYWKMNIDLSRPLVPSMGQHDPLDGYVTYLQLQTTASRISGSAPAPSLADGIDQFSSMIQNGSLLTVDPLGLGGLLLDAARGAQLMREGAPFTADRLETLLTAALTGLEHYLRQDELLQPASRRLAFRELGLAIGLHAVDRTWEAVEEDTELLSEGSAIRARVRSLKRYASLSTEIESFWRTPSHQTASTWLAHRNINEVMLATSLAPTGCVVLRLPS